MKKFLVFGLLAVVLLSGCVEQNEPVIFPLAFSCPLREYEFIAFDEASNFSKTTPCMVSSSGITQRLVDEGYFAFTQVIDSDLVFPEGEAHQITILMLPIDNKGRVISPQEWREGEYYFIENLGDNFGCDFSWFTCSDFGHCNEVRICNPQTGICYWVSEGEFLE